MTTTNCSNSGVLPKVIRKPSCPNHQSERSEPMNAMTAFKDLLDAITKVQNAYRLSHIDREESGLSTVGDLLAHIIRYGDMDEKPWPEEWHRLLKEEGQTATSLEKNDPELFWRLNIAASILGLTHNTPGGSCSMYDEAIRPFLQMRTK